MQIIIRHSDTEHFRDYQLISLFGVDDPFIELLKGTLKKDEYYAYFQMKLPIGIINESNLEEISKRKCLSHKCNIDIKRLFDNRIIDRIISLEEEEESKEYIEIRFSNVTNNNDYINIYYILCWNHTNNKIECHIIMDISSKTYMIKLMIENGVSTKLIEDFLYNYRYH
jgi:hypothetical protein